jgi:hypothetical protein
MTLPPVPTISFNLLDLPCCHIPAVLMKNCRVNLIRVVFDESHLDIGNGQEEVSFGLGQDLNLALPGWLHEKFVALASEDQTQAGNDLIFTCVSIKDPWSKLDGFMFFRWFKFGERVLAHHVSA